MVQNFYSSRRVLLGGGHDEEGAGRAEAADAEAAGVVQRAELDGGFSACSLVLACRGQHQTQ